MVAYRAVIDIWHYTKAAGQDLRGVVIVTVTG